MNFNISCFASLPEIPNFVWLLPIQTENYYPSISQPLLKQNQGKSFSFFSSSFPKIEEPPSNLKDQPPIKLQFQPQPPISQNVSQGAEEQQNEQKQNLKKQIKKHFKTPPVVSFKVKYFDPSSAPILTSRKYYRISEGIGKQKENKRKRRIRKKINEMNFPEIDSDPFIVYKNAKSKKKSKKLKNIKGNVNLYGINDMKQFESICIDEIYNEQD